MQQEHVKTNQRERCGKQTGTIAANERGEGDSCKWKKKNAASEIALEQNINPERARDQKERNKIVIDSADGKVAPNSILQVHAFA